MANFRHRVEEWFEGFAHCIYRNRIKTIVIILLLTAAAVSQIPKIKIDMSTEGFLHPGDPELLAYNAFRDQFGRDEVIMIAIKPPKVFDLDFLKMLKSLHGELEESVPYLDEITSMVNARNTRGEADELIVEDLLEHWPQDAAELEDLKQRVLSNQMYKNLMISEDGKFTTIVIRTNSHSSLGEDTDALKEFDSEQSQETGEAAASPPPAKYLTDKENSEVVNAVQSLLEKYKNSEIEMYIVGSPVVTHFLKKSMMEDMRKFVVLSIILVSLLLFIMFRRLSGVFLPLLIVILSLLATVGIMAFTGTAIKVPTQILPSFLLAVGVGTSVHILAIFFQHYREHADKEAAIVHALGHSGLAVVMTNVTTACGLLSFSTSDVAPVADVGIFAGIGVLIAFINTIVLLPAILALAPIRLKSKNGQKPENTIMDRFLAAVANFSTGHPRGILIVSLIMVALSIGAATRIRFSHHILHWFPENNSIRTATEKIDHAMQGSINLEVVVDTGKENGLYEPDFLNRLDAAQTQVESMRFEDLFVGKAWSVTTILKEINQALNENRPEFYAIPQGRELIAQEFLLFENSGSDDLEDVVDSQFAMGRFTIKAPFIDAIKYSVLLDSIGQYFETNFPQTEITLTGLIALLSKTVSNAIHSMFKSYIIALVVITILMVLLIGRMRIGLLSMVPNLVPIILMLGVIGATPVSMDLFTMLVASIAIGLAVDDTIHFMHNFRRYYEQTGDPKAAVHMTLHTTGRAMLVTSIVLSIGFFVFTFATMRNLFNFGTLTAFTILMALAADYLLAPALMVLVNPKKEKQAEDNHV